MFWVASVSATPSPQLTTKSDLTGSPPEPEPDKVEEGVGTDNEPVAEATLEADAKATAEIDEEEEETKAEDKPLVEEVDPADDEPPNLGKDVMGCLSCPINWILDHTVPACDEPHLEKYFMVTFIVSVLYIGLLSAAMVELVERIGAVLEVSDALMSLTFVAAGTSVPDALGSGIVAMRGMGDMAVSNAIGSNVFDILIGLGLPWTIRNFYPSTDYIPVHDSNIVVSSILLFSSIVFYMTSLFMNNLKLTKKLGWSYLFVYGCYLTYVLVTLFQEMSAE